LIGCGVWLVGAVKYAREAAHNNQCQGNLNQLMLALLNYHDTYKALPPAYLADANGKPIHSWRVLLLPFLGQQEIYNQYDFSEPWDGPNNRKLADKINLLLFWCPSGPVHEGSLMTNYVVVVGPKTAFPGSDSTTFDDFHDGRENTILIVEIANSNIHWMEPRDLNVDEMSFVLNDPKQPSISSPHPRGPAAVFADAISAYPLDVSLRPETLQALTTIAGEEPVFKEQLLRDPPTMSRYLAE
ncbi:MAG: DUF1559 domain-containing protein, partial [Planctomycetaceae bacterium]|nr:DUF1559 domain-containing protein [Planctomycetaceae bacterium]